MLTKTDYELIDAIANLLINRYQEYQVYQENKHPFASDLGTLKSLLVTLLKDAFYRFDLLDLQARLTALPRQEVAQIIANAIDFIWLGQGCDKDVLKLLFGLKDLDDLQLELLWQLGNFDLRSICRQSDISCFPAATGVNFYFVRAHTFIPYLIEHINYTSI